MNKLLLIAGLALSLAACTMETHNQVEIIPWGETEAVAMCTVNGGFQRGWSSENNLTALKSTRVIEYRTTYHVECKNGARIDITKTLRAE